MTERVEKLLEILRKREYRNNRIHKKTGTMCETIAGNAELFCEYMSFEEPVMIQGDRIGFYRRNAEGMHTGTGNFTPEYEMYLENGFDGVYEKMKSAADSEFAEYAVKVIEAIYGICAKYERCASGELKKALGHLPQKPPRNYYEALVMLKIIIFSLRISGSDHITLGRFDRYMYPFYENDLKNGISKDEILELTEEFFLSINFDSDLYFGVQQGDNGQSLVLGGLNEDGSDSFSELSEICMKASMELNLIDPKINLRVNKNTPDSIYLLGTQMTKLGLGFPQYSNDDVVIPALCGFGYDKSDAYNYTVAACWEFIVPGGRDIPNVQVVNFPKIVNECVYRYLGECESFAEFSAHVGEEISAECTLLAETTEKNFYHRAQPVESLFSRYCVEKAKDCSEYSAKYNNFGFHGAGIANAADALCAVKKLVFEDKKYSAEEIISALDADFGGFEEMRSEMLASPKMGSDDDYVDSIASDIMDDFCVSMKKLKSSHGGIFRPGTGSAMEYIREAKKVGATADGRYAYTPYSSSFSPSVTAHTAGPLSVIKSFTKFDMKRIANGGPLTLEIHDTTFRNDDGVAKAARLVKSFIQLGGHQLQLNAVNRDKLIDAQKHPEDYPNLIVRVWGWSGYFNELDAEYQNHIISRTEFSV